MSFLVPLIIILSSVWAWMALLVYWLELELCDLFFVLLIYINLLSSNILDGNGNVVIGFNMFECKYNKLRNE